MSLVDNLRPDSLAEFVGQDRIKERLFVMIRAAFSEQRPLNHMLITGSPGFGKTTLARLIALESGDEFESVIMPLKAGGLFKMARQFEGILLLDEIHRASASQQQELLPLLEPNGYIQGPSGAKYHPHWLTIIAATTEPGDLIEPLRQRFPVKLAASAYSREELGSILQTMAAKAGLDLPPETAEALGEAAGGVPRNARQFVLAAHDLKVVRGEVPSAADILAFCETEPDGLSVDHMAFLRFLDDLGGVASLRTLASLMHLGEDHLNNLEELLQLKRFVTISSKGRELTNEGARRVRQTRPIIPRRRVA